MSNILIGTPAYGGMVYTDYVNTIISMYGAGLRFTVASIGNESLIPRGRNTLLSIFYKMENMTHLFFLDGDIFIDGEDVKRLMSYGKDVIGAKVPLKGTDEQGNPVYNVWDIYDADKNLAKCKKLGTAVMILSREAVTALVKNADTYEHRGIECYDVFKTGVKEGQYLSEDYWVCQTLLDKKFEIYVDMSIRTIHCGTNRYI